MKRTLSGIHLLATQKVRLFFQFFIYPSTHLPTRALQV